jgi:hypothetical protein
MAAKFADAEALTSSAVQYDDEGARAPWCARGNVESNGSIPPEEDREVADSNGMGRLYPGRIIGPVARAVRRGSISGVRIGLNGITRTSVGLSRVSGARVGLNRVSGT